MYLVVLVFLVSFVSAVHVDQEIYDSLDSEDVVSVIVTLKDQPMKRGLGIASSEKRTERVKEKQSEVLNKLKIKNRNQKTKLMVNSDSSEEVNEEFDIDLKHQYTTINGFSGRITKEGLQKLIDEGLVENIYVDGVKEILLDESIPLINANDTWDLSVDGININGTGEAVCVIDTGVDYTHADLGGGFGEGYKVVSGYDFCADDSSCATEDNDPIGVHYHGTHVAGIVAANGGKKGVAPGANIVAMKACNSGGSCLDSDVLGSIQWCIDNATQFNISVISISLGGGLYTSYCDSNINILYSTYINQAVANNISVVIATGNSDSVCTGGVATGIGAPACVESAIRVTASDDSDTMGGYACRHLNFSDTLSAPGTAISSTNVGGGYRSLQGTSMATPHVSGAAALMHQYWDLAYDQTITPQELEDKLAYTGIIIDDTGTSGNNYSRIDVLAAIQPYINFTSNSPLNGTSVAASSVIINITSDVDLSDALLEWDGSTNYTMDQSTARNFYYDILLTPGNHTYKVYGNDSVGTFGVSEERILVANNTLPLISIISPINNTYYNSYFNLNITITDALLSSSIYNLTNSSSLVQQNLNYSINASIYTWNDLVNLSNSTFNDGNYSLLVWANDSVGAETSSSVNFVLDKTDPVINNLTITPTTVYNNNSVLFTLNITELNLNVSTIYLELLGENYTMQQESSEIFNFSLGSGNLTNQQTITYLVHVFDLANNYNGSETYNFTVQNRNLTSVSITFPVDGVTLELGNSTQFNSTVIDPDGDTIIYSWEFGEGNTSSEQNPTNTYSSVGSYQVNLTATDNYGSTLIDNISVTVSDTTYPVITDSSDSESHYESDSGLFTIEYNFFDYSGIKEAEVFFDTTQLTYNATYCTNMDSSIVTCSWPMEFTDPENDTGTYPLYVNITDNSSSEYLTNSTYSILLSSCQDSSENGDETGTDCGGSCSACPSDDSSSSSSGGGGGGGGGATAITATAEEEVVEEEVTGDTVLDPINIGITESSSSDGSYSGSLSLMDGQESIINIEDKEIPVSIIKIKSKEDKEVYVEVFSYIDAPEETGVIEGSYRYLKIGEQLSNISIKDVEISFEIPVSWLTENNYSKEEVRLNYFVDGAWKALKTKLIAEDEQWIMFQAEVDQFPYFAITADVEQESLLDKMKALELGKKEWVLISLGGIILLLIIVYFIIRERD